MDSQFGIVLVDQYKFNASLHYTSCPYSIEISQTFDQSFAILNPFGITGMSIRPLKTGFKVWRGLRNATTKAPTKAPTMLTLVSATPSASVSRVNRRERAHTRVPAAGAVRVGAPPRRPASLRGAPSEECQRGRRWRPCRV